MEEVNKEGPEVVAFEVSFPLGIGRKVYEQEQAWANHNYGSGIVYHVEPLCRHSEALAVIAEREARIAEQDVQIKALQSGENCWQSGYDEGRRMGGKHCMLTVDQLQAELAAIKAQEPVSWEVYYSDDDSFNTITRDKALIEYYSKMAYTIKPLYAAPVAKQVVMPEALDRAFITGESCDGVYRVVIQSETLKEMQSVHNWIVRLNAADQAEGGV